MKDESAEPKEGGNLDHYKQILGEKQKTPNAEEHTYSQWTGSAHELILLNLLQEFEKSGKPALLDVQTTKVGLAFAAHKKTQNIF